MSIADKLCAEKALIFRVVHRENIPWILDHGLNCRNSTSVDPNYVNIGNPELINKRNTRTVPIAPAGTLSDYVPFYFTPHSPMLYNITTGYGGIEQRANEDILILVSSLPKVATQGIQFVFSDRHAYLQTAMFSSDLNDLTAVDWPLLQSRNFSRDPNDPGKMERYQTEALIHRHLPVASILGVGCYSSTIKTAIDKALSDRNLLLATHIRPNWYF